jgi:ribonuclease HI
MKTVTVYTGTQAGENPGPATIGVVALESTKVLEEMSESIGNATANYAEFVAVLRALEMLSARYGDRTKEIRFDMRLSNEAVKRQLNDESAVKEPGLVPYFMAVHNMRVVEFPFLSFTRVPENQNRVFNTLAA